MKTIGKTGVGICLILALLISLVLLTPSQVQANPDWYDGDWSLRRPIIIDNTGNASDLTDYQVLIDVAYDADMQADFDDLRFTDSDGAIELSYWIEEKSDSVSAKVWVKVPLIPGSSNKTIYMYYGNPIATGASDGDSTFVFFDDFSGTTLDPSKWDNLSVPSGTATIVGGRLRLDSPAGNYNYAIVNSAMAFGDVCIQYKSWLVTWPVCPTTVDNNNAYTYWRSEADTTDYCTIARSRNHYCTAGMNYRDRMYSNLFIDGSDQGGSIVYYDEPKDVLNDPNVTFRLCRCGTNMSTYYDNGSGELLFMNWSNGFTEDAKLEIYVYGSFRWPPTTVDLDDVFVRNYTCPEPTTSVGDEEVEVVEVDIDIKPGSDPNSINLRSKGVIPIAILTTPSFDATTVDASTVTFGPGSATMVHRNAHLEDVDGDGDIDMVLHFKTQDTGIQASDIEAKLTGETVGGVAFEGTDTVNIVPRDK